MLRQLENSFLMYGPFPKGLHVPFGGNETRSAIRHKSSPWPTGVQSFPRRPDAAVIDESIPLFYIGQNRKGRWVVRESEGRSGGLFLFKQWAVRFARRQSEPFGCAIMFLAEPVELEIGKDGRCLSLRGGGVMTAITTAWHRVKSWIAHHAAAQRRHRAAVERELFGGLYTLSSKNDDDLPVAR